MQWGFQSGQTHLARGRAADGLPVEHHVRGGHAQRLREVRERRTDVPVHARLPPAAPPREDREIAK